MENETATTRLRPRSDPLLAAMRRLLTETDRSIAAADRVRQARRELAKALENADRPTK